MICLWTPSEPFRYLKEITIRIKLPSYAAILVSVPVAFLMPHEGILLFLGRHSLGSFFGTGGPQATRQVTLYGPQRVTESYLTFAESSGYSEIDLAR